MLKSKKLSSERYIWNKWPGSGPWPLPLYAGAKRLGTTTVYRIVGDPLCSIFLKSPSMGPEEVELRVYCRPSPGRSEYMIAIFALPAVRLL